MARKSTFVRASQGKTWRTRKIRLKKTSSKTTKSSKKQSKTIDKVPLSVIQDYVNDVLRKKGGLTQEIYLGGSMSPNDPKQPTKESDIDLFIIEDREKICPDLTLDEMSRYEGEYFGDILVVPTPISKDSVFYRDEHDKWFKL